MSVSQKEGSTVHEKMSMAAEEAVAQQDRSAARVSDPPASPASPTSDPTSDATSPQRIGEYLIRRMLGEGGMGRVYEAEERLSKRRVAVKVLRDELSKSDQARALFLNEMQILAHLEHPNVVRSLASMEIDGKLCIVLELLEGQTLRELLAHRERLGWQQAAFVTACVARALEAAHGQEPPVIHRDLKPENIMLLADGTVKVMDFGIAKLISALNQQSTQSVGTLQYMSPEQIDARPVDGRTDLYCLGLVLYELIAGHPPFRSASPRALLNMQCTDTAPALPDGARDGLPKGIEKLMLALLEKQPDDRPASAREVVERLEPFLPDDSPFVESASGKSGAQARSSGRGAVATGDRPQGDSASGQSDGTGTMPSQDVVRERQKTARDKRSESSPAKRDVKREDTVALVERASAPRELSLAASLAIIVGLMIAAAIGTYLWRASQGADSGARPDASARANDRSPDTTASAAGDRRPPSDRPANERASDGDRTPVKSPPKP
jgi:serine/threonine-protein kinase